MSPRAPSNLCRDEPPTVTPPVGAQIESGMSWTLAIDFGTTATAAAVFDGDTELIEVDGLARLPSLVLLGADGVPVVGAAAERQAPGHPDRVERTPKRRLGDRLVLLGDQAVDPVDLVAAVLTRVAEEARRHQGGTEPSEVVLTHPVAWVGARLASLREAARRADLGDVTLVPEPVAAAVHLSDDRISVGDHVAVYDLGGGTFDAAILRRSATGFDPVGAPGGDEHLGGEDFDEMLYDAVGRTVASRDPEGWHNLQTSEDRSWIRANSTLRNEVRAAKEALSTTPEYTIYVPQVDTEVRVTREELEELVRPSLERTVDELVATVERAGLRVNDLKAVYLVGGSSRIPLAARLVSERTGLIPLTWGDPKAAVALGAARRGTTSAAAPVVLGAAPAHSDSAASRAEASEATTTELAPVADVEERGRRTPLLVGAAILGVVLLIVAGVAFLRGGDDDGAERRAEAVAASTATTTVAADGEIARSFGVNENDGVRSARSWTYRPSDSTLSNEFTMTNVETAEKVVAHFEVVPKEVAPHVDHLTFDPAPTEVVRADPVVRHDLTLAPGASTLLRWTVVLAGPVDVATIESLAAARDAAEQAFHAENAPLVAAAPGDVVLPAAPTTTTGSSTGGPGPSSTPTSGTAPSSGGGGTTDTTAATSPTPTTNATQTTSAPTPTTAKLNAPGPLGSLVARDPIGEDYSGGIPQKVRVTLQWSPPSDNGGQAPTSYRIRCTLMYNDPDPAIMAADAPCKGGSEYPAVGGAATSTQVLVDRVVPGPGTWIRWEVAAVNSAGSGALRSAQVVVPNVKGLYTWEAWPVVRGVGLAAGGAPATSCGQPEGSICSQSRVAGTTVSGGVDLLMSEQS